MKTRILVSIIFYVCINLVLFPLNTNAEANQKLDFSNIPDKYLFDLSNMKPGDWATRNLEIQNQIGRDFTYNTSVHFKGGSKKLYKEFKLNVLDDDGNKLYAGKLNEFKGLRRYLASSNKEISIFEAKFPYELGNELQGLGFEFELRFTMDGTPPSPGPDAKPNLDPNPIIPTSELKPNPNRILSTNPDRDKLQQNPDPKQDDEEILVLDSGGNDTERELDQYNLDSGTESDLEEGLKSSRSILTEELAVLPVDGHIMPATATNLFTIMTLGVILLLSGSGLYILQRKRKRTE